MENIIETLVMTPGTRSWHISGNLPNENSDSKMFLESGHDSDNQPECYNVRVSSRNYGETTAYEVSPGIRR